MPWIDSHAHITADEIFDLTEPMLRRAREADVSDIVNICTHPRALERGRLLKQRYPFIHTVAATTPHDVENEGERVYPIIEKAALAGELVAIGETGLDYHYEHADRQVQRHFLRRYLRLAKQCSLPVVIHCREAFDDFFSILDEEGKELIGVLHCFTGNSEEADEVVRRGWYLSFSGILTFKKSEALREIAAKAPLDQLLIETDTPYLAPVPYRGKTNEPAYVAETGKCLAACQGVSVETVSRVTTGNAQKLFRIQ